MIGARLKNCFYRTRNPSAGTEFRWQRSPAWTTEAKPPASEPSFLIARSSKDFILLGQNQTFRYSGPKLEQARKSAPSRSDVPKGAHAEGRKTRSEATLCM